MADEIVVRVWMRWLLKLDGVVGIWIQGVGRNPKHCALYVCLPRCGYSISLHGVSRV